MTTGAIRGDWPRAMARRIGLGGAIDFTPTRVGQTLHVPCAGRGRSHPAHIVDVKISAHQHPDAVAKKMLGQGWKLGHRLLCPDAYRKKETAEVAAIMEAAQLHIEPEEPMAEDIIIPPAPTPAAGRALRLVFMALEDYYDDKAKAYKPGHSDASIAKETGVAESKVKQIREESFGPLAVPVDLTNILTELRQLKREHSAMCASFEERASALESRIEALIGKNGWQR